jgi:hypothetical protein
MSNTINSGYLFVRYISVGIVSLILSACFLKIGFLKAPPLVLGLFLLGINFSIVLGFTRAVSKSRLLLAETDSPDLAYYLGFGLTVGTLAITFVLDNVLLAKAGNEAKGEIVRNSLLQFGTGLTATLVGLCAKIYLSSLQGDTQSEPEEIGRKFRLQLKEFQTLIQSSSNDFSKSLRTASEEISTSAKEASSSFSLLSESVVLANDSIRRDLGDGKILDSIKAFSSAIGEFGGVTRKFLENSAEVNKTVERFSNKVNDAVTGVTSCTDSLDKYSQIAGSLNVTEQARLQITNRLIESQKELLSNVSEYSNSLNLSAPAIVGLRVELERLEIVHKELAQAMGEARKSSGHVTGSLNEFNKAIAIVTDSEKKLDDSIRGSLASSAFFSTGLTSVVSALTEFQNSLYFSTASSREIQSNFGSVHERLSSTVKELENLNQAIRDLAKVKDNVQG